MTPEQLEEIQGIGPQAVERIQEAVNSYYSQYEEGAVAPEERAAAGEEPLPGEEGLPSAEPEADDTSVSPADLSDFEGVAPESLETEPGTPELPGEALPVFDPESEEKFEPGSAESVDSEAGAAAEFEEPVLVGESDTIKDSTLDEQEPGDQESRTPEE
jgi:hypothetical protein